MSTAAFAALQKPTEAFPYVHVSVRCASWTLFFHSLQQHMNTYFQAGKSLFQTMWNHSTVKFDMNMHTNRGVVKEVEDVMDDGGTTINFAGN